MEYLEPDDCDDLLEGSDEDEDVTQANNDNGLLDLNDLEDVTVGTASAVDNPIFLDMLQPLADSDEEEEDEGKLAREEKRRMEDMARRDKMVKMLNMVAPGIDLFPPSEEEGNGFLYFSLDTLDLETDMGYTRRAKLLGHGFTSSQLDTIMSDRLQFVRHLMPEAQSVLICDKMDFRAVMNFLFYSISVCTDRSLNDLLTKAFFDLRKNYGFRWNLSLKHIMAVLQNYGVEEVLLNSRFYNKENVGLLRHLEEVRKTGQEAGDKYQLPKLPVFLQKRKGSAKRMFVAQTEQKFHFCVSRFIHLVSEFSAGLPSHLEFRYRNNWSEQIIFMYLLLLLGTDKRFIMDHRVKESISTALHYHMDSFSSSQWFWGPVNRPANDQAKQDGFNHSNVHKSMIRMVNEFFPGELCPSVITWDQGSHPNLKVTNMDGTSDHHLNMLHRIHLVPPSFRGNQVRKYLAFMYLQTLAEIHFSLPTHVDVVDLVDTPDLCDKLSDGLKMIVLSKNYQLTMTVIELYDIIVGHEPELDFTPDKVEHINRVKRGVLGWVQKKLPGIGRGVDINNEQSIKAMQLAEYLDIVEGRWQTCCNRHT